MTLPIYELKISENLTDEAQVDYIALVDAPAIKKDFLAFNDEFIEPSKGEGENDFLERCIKYVIDEGKETEQAVAICNALWSEHFNTKNQFESYTDYPKEARENAKIDCNKFSIISEEKRIISGALMLADELIYRNNEKMGEHYVKFSADTIKMIAIKFAKKKYQNNVNLMHDPEQKVKGVTMFESWLVDTERGIMPMKGFEGVANGSWFGSFYVENEKVWQSIKKGDYKGFSVEGLFDYVEPISAEENALKKIEELLNSIIED
jgi:hypothetical protein